MADSSRLRPWFIALGAGAMLWTITAVTTRRIEPWDAGAYWAISYPFAIALAGALGYFYPQRPWRWALAIIFMQVPVMLVRGAGFGLLPLGMVLLGLLCMPPILLAGAAARARLRRDAGCIPDSRFAAAVRSTFDFRDRLPALDQGAESSSERKPSRSRSTSMP